MFICEKSALMFSPLPANYQLPVDTQIGAALPHLIPERTHVDNQLTVCIMHLHIHT